MNRVSKKGKKDKKGKASGAACTRLDREAQRSKRAADKDTEEQAIIDKHQTLYDESLAKFLASDWKATAPMCDRCGQHPAFDPVQIHDHTSHVRELDKLVKKLDDQCKRPRLGKYQSWPPWCESCDENKYIFG